MPLMSRNARNNENDECGEISSSQQSYVLELNSCIADIFDEIDEIGENDECDKISSNSSSQQSYVLELNSCTADIFDEIDEIGENDKCDEISSTLAKFRQIRHFRHCVHFWTYLKYATTILRKKHC